MRNLSVVAILLGISVACSNQPAGPCLLRQGQSPSRPPASPRASRLYCAAPVHAVTLVARGSDGDVVIKQAVAQPAVEASKLQLDIALKSMMAVAQQAKSAENRVARIQSSLGILAPFVRVLRIQREDP